MTCRFFPWTRKLLVPCTALVAFGLAMTVQAQDDWTTQPVPALTAPVAANHRLLSIAHADVAMFAVGQQGVILRSADGRNWTQVESPVSQLLTRVRFLDAQRGWITGQDSVILATTDGGAHWVVQQFDANARALYDLHFWDAQHGIAVGGYGLMLQTQDGGAHWLRVESSLTKLGLHFNQIVALTDGSVLVVGERGLLAQSTDQGAHWRLLESPYAGSFFGAQALGEQAVLIYGMRGQVFVTDDIRACPTRDIAAWDLRAEVVDVLVEEPSTLGWHKLETPAKESLFGGLKLPNHEVLLLGINGDALVTELAARQLHRVTIPAKETLVGAVLSGSRVIAVGKRGVQDIGASSMGAAP